ncbi:MAG: hypothetical protein OXE98_03830 [Hyphomicrobiales bacterium]|nr:hypothetical protein [Hyphomicrobiales bacterium]
MSRNPGSNIERTARYEDKNVFNYIGADGIPHFETYIDFTASRTDTLRHDATIMRETNPCHHLRLRVQFIGL